MSELIERCARALGGVHRSYSVFTVLRAALPPTEAMIEAGADAIDAFFEANGVATLRPWRSKQAKVPEEVRLYLGALGAAYTAMLTAGIDEKPPMTRTEALDEAYRSAKQAHLDEKEAG